MGTDALDSMPFQARGPLSSGAGKHLLIFSYWFPPANAVGASRPIAIARHFADRGWRVTVVAGAASAVPPTFAADLTGFDVHYVRDSWLTRQSSFRAERSAGAQRLSTALRLLSWPDHVWTVARAMKRRAFALLPGGPPPDVILSTALPFSVHTAARAVARRTGALFVADNRDIWAHNPYKWTAPFYAPFEPGHERRMLSSADLIVAVSEGMSGYYRTAYPHLSDRILTVTNGVDEGAGVVGRAVRGSSPLRLVYTGILYGERRDVKPLLRAAQGLGCPVAIDFYGSEPDVVRQLAAEFPGLAITDRGRVSRAEALRAQAEADAAVLVVGTDPWEDTLLPGKLFEYIGSGRPIIALANGDSDSGRIIARHGLGIATTSESDIANFLALLAEQGVASRASVPGDLTRTHQLGLLEDRLTAMMSSRGVRAP
jgi:glycosyltransferase involved in cell wall biosynthesis